MGFYLGDKPISSIHEISIYKYISDYFSRELGTRTYGRLNAEDLQGLKHIKDYGFYNQDNLVYVILPETLESIGNYAFSGCDKIKNGYIRFLSPTPPKIGKYSALPTGGGMKWYVPKGCLDAYLNDEYFSQYSSYLKEYGV